MLLSIILIFFVVSVKSVQKIQYGPDPWDVGAQVPENYRIPPDIQIAMSSRRNNNEGSSVGDYFFRRLLSVMLKSGAVETLEDGSKEITIAMKIPKERWNILQGFIKLEKPFTDDVYRTSVGYVSDAIYKPSLAQKVVQAWSEYVLSYYYQYQHEISWILIFLTGILSIYLLVPHISLKVVAWTTFILLYLYEGFLSYKEHEKNEYDKFVSALNNCKWKFWSSSCDVPISDSINILKYMHPLKIGLRLAGHFIMEPLVMFSSTVNEISNEITRNLYPPFNSIANGIIIIIFNVIFVTLTVMILFTFLLRRTFNISFLYGLIDFGLKKPSSDSTYLNGSNRRPSHHGDRISGENLQKIIDLLSARKISDKQNISHMTEGKSIKSARESRSVKQTAITQRSLSACR